MKKIIVILIMSILSGMSEVYAFNTFTEKVNPFNKFLNPIEGVDLYSGTVAFTKTLYTMEGRNGLNIGINLDYSSNIYMVARSRNDKNPTSWVGLGWNLSYGSISCEHKGTENPADDDYFWVSPEGYKRRIYVEFVLDPTSHYPQKDENDIALGKIQIEDMPYLKVKCYLGERSKFPFGWQIIKKDGTVLTYGDLVGLNPSDRKATRYTYKINNCVEPNINVANHYNLYPYQWDLSDIADNHGNHIVFKYFRDDEQVKSKEWGFPDPGIERILSNSYTKASYIKEIINPEGKSIEFEVVKKFPTEYYDPYTFSEEPDGHIERIQQYALKSISVKNVDKSLIKRFTFEFKRHINMFVNLVPIKADYQKRLLTNIYEFNAKGEQKNVDVFTYYYEFLKADESSAKFDENYNYGALKTHRDMNGYFAEYEYERQELILSKTSSGQIELEDGDLKIAMGYKTDGNPFCVITGYGYTIGKFCVVNWNGSEWEKEQIELPEQLLACEDAHAGKGFFALGGFKEPDVYSVGIFNWDEKSEKWILYDIYDIGGTSFYWPDKDRKRLNGQLNYFVFRACKRNPKLYIWNRFKNSNNMWVKTAELNPVEDYPGGEVVIQYLPNRMYCYAATNYSNLQSVFVFNWDGSNWIGEFIEDTQVDPRKYNSISAQSNFFALLEDKRSRHTTNLKVFNFDGNSWMKTFYELNARNYWPVHKDIASTSKNSLISRSGEKQLDVLTWDGCKWKLTWSRFPVPDYNYEYFRGLINDNYFIIHTAVNVETFYEERFSWDRFGDRWIVTYPKQQCASSWHYDCETYISDEIPNIHMQDDFFVTDIWRDKDDDDARLIDVDAYCWNGQEWSAPFGSNSAGGAVWPQVKFIATTKKAFGLTHDGGSFSCHYKFQNSFGDMLNTYTLKKKTFKPGFGQKTEIIRYRYDDATPERCVPCNGNYDTKNFVAKFNRVGVKLDNNAEKIYYHFNDRGTDDNQEEFNPEFKKLDGLVYRIENLNSGGSLIATRDTINHFIHRNDEWIPAIYHTRVRENITRLDHVRTNIKNNYSINSGSLDINGLPRFKFLQNSDGNNIAEYTLFAFERPEYQDIINYGQMLDQPCLKLVLENGPDITGPLSSTWYEDIDKNIIRSATAITWECREFPNLVTYMPKGAYVWNVAKDNTGIPVSDFTGFRFDDPSLNSSAWKFVYEITNYNQHGQVIESRKPVSNNPDLYSAIIYRSDIAKPMANIINARYDKCAIFTCDYDMNDPDHINYFDFENGWEKGGSNLSVNVIHFGHTSVGVVNCFGPTKNVKFDHTKNHIFSAWMRWISVETSKFARMAVEFHSDIPNGDATRIGHWDKEINLSEEGSWKLYEHIIKSEELAEHLTSGSPSDIEYVRIWIGRGESDPECCFTVDDIRFYPSEAYVITTYYDNLWEKPIVSIDANNNPGAKMPRAMSREDMLDNNIASIDEEGTVGNYIGNLSADVLGVDIYYDQIWEKPKPLTRDDPGGKVEYDQFGRMKKWYKMERDGITKLIAEKKFDVSGFLFRCKLVRPDNESVPISDDELLPLVGLKGDDVYFPYKEEIIICNQSFVHNSTTYNFDGWEIIDGHCIVTNPNNNTTQILLGGVQGDVVIRPKYTH